LTTSHALRRESLEGRGKMPDRRKRKIKLKSKDVALAQRIVGGMSIEQAKTEVGVRLGGPTLTQNQTNIVEAMREEKQKQPGHRFDDAADYYLDAATGKKKREMPQLYARSRHDKIMGYDAPQKVEVHERHEITQAVMVLHKLAEKTGLSPAELFTKIKEPQNVVVEHQNAIAEISKGSEEAEVVCGEPPDSAEGSEGVRTVRDLGIA
jgi:hypothetical protein